MGTRLKDFASQLTNPLAVPFAEVSHWIAPRVEGHGGALVNGAAAGSIDAATLRTQWATAERTFALPQTRAQSRLRCAHSCLRCAQSRLRCT